MSYTIFGVEPSQKIILQDGFILAGVNGKLTTADSNQIWSFEFDSDLSDEQNHISAGASLELLPSSTLEKMTADTRWGEAQRSPVGNHGAGGHRLWGKATKYKGRNFIYPIYFLPLSKVKQAESSTPQPSQPKEPQVIINEPEDLLAIPQEIIAKIKTQKTLQPEQPEKGLELEQDTILPERTGFIAEKGGQPIFELDAFGQKAGEISFQLLACQVLERLQQMQSAEPDPVRFKVTGIVTKYKGRSYLLLQRAIRAYSHDNFGR